MKKGIMIFISVATLLLLMSGCGQQEKSAKDHSVNVRVSQIEDIVREELGDNLYEMDYDEQKKILTISLIFEGMHEGVNYGDADDWYPLIPIMDDTCDLLAEMADGDFTVVCNIVNDEFTNYMLYINIDGVTTYNIFDELEEEWGEI